MSLVPTERRIGTAGTSDAGNVYRSQVWTTADDGAHWEALGAPIDPSLVLVTIEVAASDPLLEDAVVDRLVHRATNLVGHRARALLGHG